MRYNAEAPDVITPYSTGHLYSGLPSHEPIIPAYPLSQPAIPVRVEAVNPAPLTPEAPVPTPSVYALDPQSRQMHGELAVLQDVEAIVNAHDADTLYVPDVLGEDRNDGPDDRDRHLVFASTGGSNGSDEPRRARPRGSASAGRPATVLPSSGAGAGSGSTGSGRSQDGGGSGGGSGRSGGHGGSGDGGNNGNHGPAPGEEGDNPRDIIGSVLRNISETGRASQRTWIRELGLSDEEVTEVMAILVARGYVDGDGEVNPAKLADLQALVQSGDSHQAPTPPTPALRPPGAQPRGAGSAPAAQQPGNGDPALRSPRGAGEPGPRPDTTPALPPRPEKPPVQVQADAVIAAFEDKMKNNPNRAYDYDKAAEIVRTKLAFWEQVLPVLHGIRQRQPTFVMKADGALTIDGEPAPADDPDVQAMRQLIDRQLEFNRRADTATRTYFGNMDPAIPSLIATVGEVADRATDGDDAVFNNWIRIYAQEGVDRALDRLLEPLGLRIEQGSNVFMIVDSDNNLISTVDSTEAIPLVQATRNVVMAGNHYAGRPSPGNRPDTQRTPEPDNQQRYENDLVERLKKQPDVTVRETASGYVLHVPGDETDHQLSGVKDLETWLARVNPDEAINALLQDTTLTRYRSDDILRALRRSKVHWYTDFTSGPQSLTGATRVIVGENLYAVAIDDEKLYNETGLYLQELKAQLALLAKTDKSDFNSAELNDPAILRLPPTGPSRRNGDVKATLKRIAAENPEDRDPAMEGLRDSWHAVRNIHDPTIPAWLQLSLRSTAAPEKVKKIQTVVFAIGTLAAAAAGLAGAGLGISKLVGDDSAPKHNDAKPSASASPFASQTPDSKPAAPAESASPKASKTPQASPSKPAASKAPGKVGASPSKAAQASKTPGRTSSSPVAPSASAKPTGRTSSNPSTAPSKKPAKSPEVTPSAQDKDRNGDFNPSTSPKAKPSTKPSAKPTTPKPSKPAQGDKQGDTSETNKPDRPTTMPPQSEQPKNVVITKDGPITIAYDRKHHTATGTLANGGTVWNMVADSLEAAGGKTPDPAQVQRLTGDILKKAGISWGEARFVVDEGSTATIQIDKDGKAHVVDVKLR